MDISTDTSLDGYFGDLLEEALGLRGVQLEASLKDYLVGVLVSFASASGEDLQLLLGHPSKPDNDQQGFEAATRVCEEASEPGSSATEAFHDFKSLGDEALFLWGFFGPWSQAREDLGLSVQTIGRGAYRAAVAVADGLVRQRFADALQCVTDVVDDFDAYAHILAEVREGTSFAAAADNNALFLRWQSQPTAALARRMAELGVYPGGGGYRG